MLAAAAHMATGMASQEVCQLPPDSAAMVLEMKEPRWERVTKFDKRGAALADRHYSRRKVGSPQFMPPGRTLVFVTTDGRAVWGTHWPLPHLAMDGMDAWRCSIFRNEGPRLSSELIVEAMDLTAQLWQDRPRDGWLTFVKVAAVRSANPGACFKAAGWELDRTWQHKKLVRLTAPVPSEEAA